MLCIARTTLSQDVCLFVCLSQAGTYVETAKHSMKLFSPLGSNTILVFFLYKRYGNIPTIAAIFTSHTLDARPRTGAFIVGDMKKSLLRPISRFISEMTHNQAIVTMECQLELVCDPSIGAISSDLERSLT